MTLLSDIITGATPLKLGLAVAGLLAFAAPLIGWVITAHTLHGVRDWQSDVVFTTSHAAHALDKSGKPGLLNAKDVAKQIIIMGAALDKAEALSAAILAKNLSIGAAQTKVAKESQDDITTDIAKARAAGATHISSVRSAACPSAGNSSAASAPATAHVAAGSGGSSGVPLLDEDDVRICSDNTVKALGWKKFDAELNAIPQ